MLAVTKVRHKLTSLSVTARGIQTHAELCWCTSAVCRNIHRQGFRAVACRCWVCRRGPPPHYESHRFATAVLGIQISSLSVFNLRLINFFRSGEQDSADLKIIAGGRTLEVRSAHRKYDFIALTHQIAHYGYRTIAKLSRSMACIARPGFWLCAQLRQLPARNLPLRRNVHCA